MHVPPKYIYVHCYGLRRQAFRYRGLVRHSCVSAHMETLEKIQERVFLRAYYLANPEQLRATTRAWRVDNEETVVRWAKDWAMANPSMVKFQWEKWVGKPKPTAAVKVGRREMRRLNIELAVKRLIEAFSCPQNGGNHDGNN